MKKTISLLSITAIHSLILGIIAIICIRNKNFTILFTIFVIYLALKVYAAKKNKHLPGSSEYNPLGFIELHIDRRAKKKPSVFYKLCIKTIFTAREENKDVLFYTWHVPEEKIRRIFGEAIKISKPSLCDKILLFAPFLLGVMPIPLPNPYIKCYVETDKLPESFLCKYSKYK